MLDEAETKGWRAEKGEGKRNRGESREKREKAPLGEARLSEEEGTRDATRSISQAVAKPSEVAKRSGTPNSRIVTRPEVSGRAGPRQPLCPRETIMGTLSTGKRRGSDGWSGRVRAIPRLCLDLHAASGEAVGSRHAAEPCDSSHAKPERSRTDDHWMHQHAHAGSGFAVAPPFHWHCSWYPARDDTSGDFPHRPRAGFHRLPCAVRVRDPFLIGRTAQRASGLEGEVLPRETANFEGGGNRGLAIATGTGRLLFGLEHRRSKLGGAQGERRPAGAPVPGASFHTHCETTCQHSCPQAEWLHQRSGSISRSSSESAGA